MFLISSLQKMVQGFYRFEIDRPPEPTVDRLPQNVWQFLWFFMRPVKGVLFLALGAELVFSLCNSLSYWFIGQFVKQESYVTAFWVAGATLLFFQFFCGNFLRSLYDFMLVPYFGNFIRRQLYWMTARQSLSFFQNDFAGRIANKVLQANAIERIVRSCLGSIWYVAIFTLMNITFMAQASLALALVFGAWFLLYVLVLCYYVPKIHARSKEHSAAYSLLTGQMVDGLSNLLSTKYFARTDYEDARLVGFLKGHSEKFKKTTGTIWQVGFCISLLHFAMIAGVVSVCFMLMAEDRAFGIATLAMALPMALQASNQSGWIMFEVTSIFENLGVVQDMISSLSQKREVQDRAGAMPLKIEADGASVSFNNVDFRYQGSAEETTLFKQLSLDIPAGQKVGLVGRSGAGKSTLVNLLMRAYDVGSGEILVAGQNIREVQQESLRSQITFVTQESALFHRSVRENIKYGRLSATEEQVYHAARLASADDFIQELSDAEGRCGYDAFVGERGVKLSGGQRQRVSLARAILKDAPILILDEATSALDSESEVAIQTALSQIMRGKTVIAIAHRLSTLRQMDRILVMENGRIVEDGSHEVLLEKENGRYAKMWQMQSGGFLKDEEEKD